tara:strand:- start:736 stop:1110 length:375 start_codon:yes stop_codon:yes gene_type:complete
MSIDKLIEDLKNFIETPEMEKQCTPLTNERWGFDRTGVPHSDTTKEIMSMAQKGKKFTEEHKQKLRDARRTFISNGGSSWNKGKTLSDEHKTKIKENHKGMKGKTHSKESRKLMSEKAKLRDNK